MLIFDQLEKNDPPLRLLALTVFGGMVMLLVGLWWAQVVSGNYYEARRETQSFRTVRMPAIRGKILDRNGTALAENQPSYNVSLYLEELSARFREQYARTRPVRVVTNSPPFWKRWLGASTVTTQYVKLNKDQLQTLTRQSRYCVASNVVAQIGRRFGQPLTLDAGQFQVHYEKDRAIPLTVVANLDAIQIACFQEQSAPVGFDLDVQPIRSYPHHATAAHLLGYVRRDDSSAQGEDAFFNHRLPDYRGFVGIEGSFDQELRGRAGGKSVLVNNLGYRQTENIWSPPEPGRNVVLTIDLPIQQAAERALQRMGAGTRGAVVVMDARNGDVLAMVSSPTYDPNQFVQGMTHEEWARLNDPKRRPQINRAMQENYAPGSIFKPVVALAALEAGLNPSAIYNVEGDPKRPGRGCIYVGKRKIEDTAPPGEYNFKKALIHSSNAYFVTNGLKAGIQNIIRLSQQLHLGERSGLSSRQEASGILPSIKRVSGTWYDGDTANICIGQGPIAVTPLQMAVVATAIANNGKVFWPRLVQRIESQDITSTTPPTLFQQGRIRDQLRVRPENLRVLREAMLADVEESGGTGTRAAVPGLRICAKTGTAQVMNEKNVKVDQTTWFTSFAPYESPRYVVVVMVESGASGGETCAPIAGEIYRAIQKRDQPGTPKSETLAQAK